MVRLAVGGYQFTQKTIADWKAWRQEAATLQGLSPSSQQVIKNIDQEVDNLLLILHQAPPTNTNVWNRAQPANTNARGGCRWIIA